MPHNLTERAEAVATTSWQTAEYALSLERLRSVGRLVAHETLDIQTVPDVLQLRAEFDTSLSEMLKTDEEFGKVLQISRFEQFRVIDGELKTHDGRTSITSSLQRGYELSSWLAEQDPRMQTQADRDWQDLENAHEVEAMALGKRDYNTRIVASLMPEEAIERDGADYWRGMGYFPETKTAFLQLYHVTDKGEVLTGALSVDATDKVSMRRLWATLGVEIPEDETTDNWLQYALTANLTAAQAKQLVLDIRQQHYQNVNHIPTHPTSVEEVLDASADIVEQAFSELQLSLAEATATRQKTATIAQLLAGFMPRAHKLNSDICSALLRAHNRNAFDDHDARLAYKLIMYATAEQLRKSLPLNRSTATQRPSVTATRQPEFVPPQVFMQQIIHSAYEGISQNRSYGACGVAIKLGSDAERLAAELDPQNVFGGKKNETDAEQPHDEDQYGPLTFECTEGHKNRRKRGQLLDKCQRKNCEGSVGCG